MIGNGQTDPRFRLDAPLLLVSYPKSGNTWVRVFLSNYLANAPKPLDIDDLRFFRHIAQPSIFERLVGYPASDLPEEQVPQLRCAMHAQLHRLLNESPCFKVHDAYYLKDGRTPLFPPECGKVVYLVRNPLDVCISWDHFYNIQDLDLSCACLAGSAPRRASNGCESAQLRQYYGSWSAHVEGWTQAPGLHLLVMRYEDMRADPLASFSSLLAFLGLPHDGVRLQRALEASQFERLQAKEREQGFSECYDQRRPFFRAGGSGDGHRLLSQNQIAAMIEHHGVTMRRFGYLD
jgi:hypothetical protein